MGESDQSIDPCYLIPHIEEVNDDESSSESVLYCLDISKHSTQEEVAKLFIYLFFLCVEATYGTMIHIHSHSERESKAFKGQEKRSI